MQLGFACDPQHVFKLHAAGEKLHCIPFLFEHLELLELRATSTAGKTV